jgi:hypothetical protein
MTTAHPRRHFESSNAKSLHGTIPAQIVSDFQSSSEADDPIHVTSNGDRLIITPNTRKESDR